MLLSLLYLHSYQFEQVKFSDRVEPLVGGSILFSPVHTEDAGYYRCRATNQFGTAFLDYLLLVSGESHTLTHSTITLTPTHTTHPHSHPHTTSTSVAHTRIHVHTHTDPVNKEYFGGSLGGTDTQIKTPGRPSVTTTTATTVTVPT